MVRLSVEDSAAAVRQLAQTYNLSPRGPARFGGQPRGGTGFSPLRGANAGQHAGQQLEANPKDTLKNLFKTRKPVLALFNRRNKATDSGSVDDLEKLEEQQLQLQQAQSQQLPPMPPLALQQQQSSLLPLPSPLQQQQQQQGNVEAIEDKSTTARFAKKCEELDEVCEYE